LVFLLAVIVWSGVFVCRICQGMILVLIARVRQGETPVS
jgi:hypothetical protein